ncbi:MAG: hypothetical protein MUP81_05475 [Dehalococcoidia bacterium]|nr:hypothetical protein [Dehalococcoidia bacterium]
MATHAKKPLIQVSQETKERLDKLGRKGQTYNDIIVDLLNSKVWQLKERHADSATLS